MLKEIVGQRLSTEIAVKQFLDQVDLNKFPNMLPLTSSCLPNAGQSMQLQSSQYLQMAEAYTYLLRLQQQNLNPYAELNWNALADLSTYSGLQPCMFPSLSNLKADSSIAKPLPVKPLLSDTQKDAGFMLPNTITQQPARCAAAVVPALPVKQRMKIATPRRYAYKKIWTDSECILLLLCTRMLIYRELKTITRAFYQCIERKPGVCWGRAAEKKLKRMITFKNWKTCNKNKVLEEIDLQLKSFGASPKVSRDSKLFKVVHRIITKKSEPELQEDPQEE